MTTKNPSDLIKVIERIRKLLAMARDKSSPNESAIAMQRARSLMDSHQLTEADIDLDSEHAVTIDSIIIEKYKYMPVWKTGLINTIARFNDCYAVRHNDSEREGGFAIIVHGFKDDVDLTCMMYANVVDSIVDSCAEDQASRGFSRYNAAIGDEFKRGYSTAVIHQLNESSEIRRKTFVSSNGNSLVLSKEESVLNGLKAKGIELVSGKSINMRPSEDTGAYWKGYVKGMNYRVMGGINEEPNNQHDCPLDDSCTNQGCPYHYADPQTLPINQDYVNHGYQNRFGYLSAVAANNGTALEFTINLSNQLGHHHDFSGLLDTLKQSAV